MDPSALSGMGLGNVNFSMGLIIAGTIFSGIGFVAFRYGKTNGSWQAMGIGVALMIMPFFIQDTLILCLVSSALIAALFVFRD